MAKLRTVPYLNAVHTILDFPSSVQMKFPNVGMRFLPLRANATKLQAILDRYLNFTDETDGKFPFYFKALGSFVVVNINNFNRLEFQHQWLTQHETIFSFPVEWYEKDEKGNFRFRDWGMTSTYLFLDNPISCSIGRDVFGWPKRLVRLPQLPPCTAPTETQRLFALELPEYEPDNPNKPHSFKLFLELCQDPPHGTWLPSSEGDLFTALPRTISGTINTAAEIWQAWANMIVSSPGQVPTADTLQYMLQRGFGYARDWSWQIFARVNDSSAKGLVGTPFMNNQFVLKQFRDAEHTEAACYQALVRSAITFDRVNDAGLLFDPLSGDPSGGLSIRVYDYDQQPLMHELGIEIAGAEIEEDTGRSVAVLKPIFPFWWNLDLDYSQAEALCWRGRNSGWSTPAKKGDDNKPDNKYLLVGAGSRLELPGPFKFGKDVTIRGFQLETEDHALQNLCSELFHDDLNLPYTVTPIDNSMSMIITQFGMMSLANDLAPEKWKQYWSDTQVTLGFGAKLRKDGSEFKAFLPLVNFVITEWDAATNREEYGRISLQAAMTAPAGLNQSLVYGLPPDTWHSPVTDLSFLLKTQLCPSTADWHPRNQQYSLIGIRKEKGAKRPDESMPHPYEGLGLSFPSNESQAVEMRTVALKQIRDATDPDRKACYQALVLIKRNLDAAPMLALQPPTGPGAHDPKGPLVFTDEPLAIYIREYTNIKIVSSLKLKAERVADDPLPGSPSKSVDIKGRYKIVPANSFYYEGPVTDLGATNLCWRLDKEWQTA